MTNTMPAPAERLLRFDSDYLEGACPQVLQALVDTNDQQTVGYGEDAYCARARDRIRAMAACPQAGVHFLTGGTQANLILAAAALRPFEGVLAADTGHIETHETGAVEATGHKVLPLPGQDGKLTAAAVEAYVRRWRADPTWEHLVRPAMVYVSQTTELGTVYSLAEMEALSAVCHEQGLILYVDGARLAYALAAEGADVTLPRLAELCDAFTIGGTKAGALFGEAMVIPNPRLDDGFRSLMKQRGALLAKGRLLGVQFDALLAGGVYEAIGRHAVSLALAIKAAFLRKGCPMLIDSPTNQQFPILTQDQADLLGARYGFSLWARLPQDRLAVRFCTGFATRPEDAARLIADIDALPAP